jgi:hypothetical protein
MRHASDKIRFFLSNARSAIRPLGDADGVRLEHISELFRLKGGDVFGDMPPRSASRLAILPNTTHVTLMDRMTVIVPMVNDFLDAKWQKQ